MRCGACGARNAEDAAWCTQCYATLVAASAVEAAGSELRTATPADGTAQSEALPSDSPGADSWTGRDVRAVDGEVEWRCGTCDSWVALETPLCGTCGAPRSGFGDAATPSRQVTDVPEQTLLATSVLLPGLGHVLAGRTGSGVTRMLLWLLWAAGGLWWVLSTGQGRLPGTVLIGGAVILWGATLVDANAITKGAAAEPFGVRGLLWTVVGVTGLLMLVVAVVAAGALGS